MDAFYEQVRADDILGVIFDDVAHVDWERHLPKMYAFWESVLFGAPGFKGNPLAMHRELARHTPLTSVEFDRWLDRFHATLDSLFAGPMAEEARCRAVRIAAVMQHGIAQDASGDR